MNEEKIIIDLLNAVLDIEYKSEEYYRRYANLTSLENLREDLLKLAEEEKKHIYNLKCLKKSFSGNNDNNTAQSTNSLAIFHEAEHFVSNNHKIKSFQDLIKFALKQENLIIEFYEKILQKLKGYNAAKDIIDDLIKKENSHKTFIASLAVERKYNQNYIDNIKNIILFDLDGTLINASLEIKPADVFLRPHSIELLDILYKKYLLCIYSRADHEYIGQTLKICGIEKYFYYCFDDNYSNDGIKNISTIFNKLSLPKFLLKKIILIDDSHTARPEANVLKIYKFTGAASDSLFAPSSFIPLIENKFKSLNHHG